MPSEPLELGILSHIWRYPVKSLRAEPLATVAVGADGLDGDRRRALVVTASDHPRSGKPYRGKEDERLHRFERSAEAVGAAAQRGVQLEELADSPHFDAAPVSLLLDAWLGDLEALLALSLDPLRFRPNLYVRTSGAVPREPVLVGATIEVASVRLRVIEPTIRCVTTTYDIETSDPNPDVLQTLARQRAAVMGVYCTILRSGDIAVGARVNAYR